MLKDYITPAERLGLDLESFRPKTKFSNGWHSEFMFFSVVLVMFFLGLQTLGGNYYGTTWH